MVTNVVQTVGCGWADTSSVLMESLMRREELSQPGEGELSIETGMGRRWRNAGPLRNFFAYVLDHHPLEEITLRTSTQHHLSYQNKYLR